MAFNVQANPGVQNVVQESDAASEPAKAWSSFTCSALPSFKRSLVAFSDCLYSDTALCFLTGRLDTRLLICRKRFRNNEVHRVSKSCSGAGQRMAQQRRPHLVHFNGDHDADGRPYCSCPHQCGHSCPSREAAGKSKQLSILHGVRPTP